MTISKLVVIWQTILVIWLTKIVRKKKKKPTLFGKAARNALPLRNLIINKCGNNHAVLTSILTLINKKSIKT
jgi:hypothetical protein